MPATEKVTRTHGSSVSNSATLRHTLSWPVQAGGLEVEMPQFTMCCSPAGHPARRSARTRRERIGLAADRCIPARAIGRPRRQHWDGPHIHGAAQTSRLRPAQEPPGKRLTSSGTAAPVKRAMIHAGHLVAEERGHTFDHVTRYDPGCVPVGPQVHANLQPNCTENCFLEEPVSVRWIRFISSEVIRSDDQLPAASIMLERSAVELNIVGPEGPETPSEKLYQRRLTP